MWDFLVREGLVARSVLTEPTVGGSGWLGEAQMDYVCHRLRGSWGQRSPGLGYLLTAATGWYSVG